MSIFHLNKAHPASQRCRKGQMSVYLAPLFCLFYVMISAADLDLPAPCLDYARYTIY